MAVSIVGAGTASHATGTTTPTLPAGLAADDLLVMLDMAWSSSLGTPPTPGTPSGWTQHATAAVNGVRVTWLYRTWTSGVTAPSVTLGAGGEHQSRILALRDAPVNANPTDILGTASSTANSATAIGSISGVAASEGSVVLVAGARNNDLTDGAGISTLSGDSLAWTEVTDYGGGVGVNWAMAWDCAPVPTARTVTAKSFAITGNTVAAPGIGQMWVIKPGLTSVPLSDTGGGNDPLSIAASTTVSDTATGSDAISIAQLDPIAVADAGIGSDTVVVAEFIAKPVSDTGVGTDAISIARTTYLDLADTGEGADSTALLERRSLTDSGVGIDSALAARDLRLADTGEGRDEIQILRIPFTQFLPLRTGPIYDVVVVARIPQVNGPPAFVEVDPIEWSSIKLTNTLSQPQELTASCLTAGVTASVAQRLRQLHNLATEIWVYRAGLKVFAGPVLGWQTSGENLTITAGGLLTYLRMMTVVADTKFKAVDQFTVVRSLIDAWQNLEYGDFGIDTDTVGASGVEIDATYPRNELHNVGQRIEELSRAQNGFDVEIDPVSRKLQLWHPMKGVDRSTGEDAIVIDGRNITSADVICSVAIEDLASEAFGSATAAGSDTAMWASASNPELRARYGRTSVTATWSNIPNQAQLNVATAGLLDARGEALLVPGPNVRITPDADFSAYSEGDLVAYDLQSQLGVSGSFRLRTRAVSVSPTGQETIDLEFV